ncbi:MAG: 4Fe-4S dicluster domain-containing protein [Candidatus Bathyarchaeia archaeon]
MAKEIAVIERIPRPKYKLEVKPELCTGCERCVLICSLSHYGVFSPSLASIRIVKKEFVLESSVEVCRQCLAPDCMVVCPIGSIYADPKTGARIVDKDKCTGCKLCVDACPFGVMFFNEEKKKAFNCDLCGGDPQCVKYCPTRSIEYVKVGGR